MAKDPAIKDKVLNLFEKLDAGDGFPPVTGNAVYAVFIMNIFSSGAEHLVYIGSSGNIEKRRRSKSHPYMLLFNRFSGSQKIAFIKYFYSEEYRDDERIMIKYFQPIFNKRG